METKAFVINLIKHKRELSGIDNRFIEGLLDEYISKNNGMWAKIISHPKLDKSRELKIVVKDIRKILREIHGVFNIDINKRKKLLAELEILVKANAPQDEVEEIHKKLLLTHKSTRERLHYYYEIYKRIFEITGKPTSILDIASGLNPVSIIFMGLTDVKYFAMELTQEDCNFLKNYFKIMHINGIAIKMNLIEQQDFPKADVCFVFKVLDSLETIERNISKKILEHINSKYIIVSFPKKTLSGKELGTKRLSWFKKLAKNPIVFEVENEIFYVIQNK